MARQIRQRRLSMNDRRARLFERPAKRVGSWAMIQPQVSAKVTTAALRKVEDGLTRPLADDWQGQAYVYADSIGEIGYVFNLKAQLVARCTLQPQRFDPEARDWVNTEDEKALRVMAAFVGPQGGQAELKRRAALHLSIAGESLLLGEPTDQFDSAETGVFWEFLSTDELRIVQGQRPQRREAGMGGEEVSADAYMARCWRPHPRFSALADSEMRRVLGLCKEIELLGQYVDAVAKSQLPAGILFVPDEMSFTPLDEEADDVGTTEEGEDIDEFSEDLIRHMSKPVSDPASAARLVPLLMRGPGEYGETVKLIELGRTLDTFAQELRAEALARLARGLDVPPEVMTGKADVAYWTSTSGANMDVDFIQRHVVPPGRVLADFLTFAYLRPMLEVYEDVPPEESMLYRLSFDESPILVRQDEGLSARSLYELDPEMVSIDTVRASNGFDEADAPEDEEVQQRRAWQLILAKPEQFAQALLPMIPGFEGVDPESIAPPAAGGGLTLDGGAAPPAREEEVPSEAPAEAPAGEEEELPAAAALLRHQLAAYADAALIRALDVAGSRIASRAKGHPEIRDRIRSVKKTKCLSLLRPSDLRTLGLTPDAVLAGAWDDLSLCTRRWIGEHLVAGGVEALTADDRAALAASGLQNALDAWVKQQLHGQFPPQAFGLRVPCGLVDQALRVLDLEIA